MGKALSAHRDEHLIRITDEECVKLHLQKGRPRHDGLDGKTRYRFTTVDRTPIAEK